MRRYWKCLCRGVSIGQAETAQCLRTFRSGVRFALSEFIEPALPPHHGQGSAGKERILCHDKRGMLDLGGWDPSHGAARSGLDGRRGCQPGEKAPSRALPEYGQRAETLSTNRPCQTASYNAAVLDTDVLSHKWEWAQVEMRTLCSSTVSFYSLDICLLLPGV